MSKSSPSKEITKKSVYIGFFQIFCAIFFALILILLSIGYGGEFVIIYENIWIVIVFSILLICSSVYSTLKLILFLKSGRWRGFRLKNIEKRAKWLISWSIWNLFIGFLLIALFIIIFILLIDVLSGILLLLIIVLGIPFLGYGIL